MPSTAPFTASSPNPSDACLSLDTSTRRPARGRVPRARRAALIVSACGAIALSLTACSTKPATPTVSTEPSLDGSSWVLASLGTRSSLPGTTTVSDTQAGPGSKATLTFSEGRAYGTDGCNRFTMPYTIKDGTLTWPSRRPAATQMACSRDAMEQGAAFMQALAGTDGYRVSGGNLQLLAPDGRVQATFVPQARSLAGTTWRATAINNGKGAVASLVADSTVTLSFGRDGQVSGSAGCNPYTAAYTAEGESLRVQSAAATRRMCAADGVMEQEQAFLNALGSVGTARREGDRLELRTAAGALAAVFVLDPAAQ